MCTGGWASMLDGAGKWLYHDSESAHPTFSSPTTCLLWTGAVSWLTHGSCLLTDVMIAWWCLLTWATRTQLPPCCAVPLFLVEMGCRAGCCSLLPFAEMVGIQCRTETPWEPRGQWVCVSGGATAQFWPPQQVLGLKSHTNPIVTPCCQLESEAKTPQVRALPKVIRAVWGRVEPNTGFLDQTQCLAPPNPLFSPQVASVPDLAVS